MTQPHPDKGIPLCIWLAIAFLVFVALVSFAAAAVLIMQPL